MASRKRMSLAVMAVVVLAIIFAAGVLGCGSDEGSESLGDEAVSMWDKSIQEEPDMEATSSAPDASQGEDSSIEELSGNVSDVSTLPQLQLLVIKTALVRMETSEGEYTKIRTDAVSIASSVGGYVESESSSKDDEGLTYASITLRVPSQNFDEVMSQVSELGEVTSSEVSTKDVSSEYVDLESRLKHLQAEEAFYLTLMGQAQTIEEMITIREHLSSIQLEKEQIQGRKNFLDQQISYSTVTLTVEEVSPQEEEEGFWASVKEAFKSFARGLGYLAIGFFYALPYLVIILILLLLAWVIVKHSKRDKGEVPGPPQEPPTQ